MSGWTEAPEGVPSWEEGIAHLIAKLPGLVAGASLTINDCRVIQHLAGERERIRGLAVARGATCPDGPDWPDAAAAAYPPPAGLIMFADLIPAPEIAAKESGR